MRTAGARRRGWIGLASVPLLLGTAFVETAAAVTQITSCSFTVSAPGTYNLAADLGPCPADGIVVTASSVVIDLRGRRLFGSGDSLTNPHSSAGVRLNGVSNVVVTSTPPGGQIDRFHAGVLVDSGSSRNVVQNLNIHDNIGQLSEAAFGNELGDGILIRSASQTVVQNNTLRHNGPFSGVAVGALTDDVGRAIGPNPVQNVIRNNRVVDNDLPRLACQPAPQFVTIPPPCPPGTSLQPFFQEDIGIRIEGPGAQRNIVSGNTVERNGSDGVLISFVDNTNFPEGDPPLNPPNPEIFGNIISNNTIRDNGFGLPPFSFVPALVGNGIQVLSIPFDFPPNIAPPHHNTIINNTVTGSKNSGIAISPQAHDNLISGNTALGNNVGMTPPGPFGGAFDLKDSNEPTTPPNMTPCNNNRWTNNTFGTRNQALTPTCIS